MGSAFSATGRGTAHQRDRPNDPWPEVALMPQIFHRSFNTISRVSIFGAVFFVAAILAALAMWMRSAYATNAGIPRTQPVPFSHEHHVTGLGIDCRYCHTGVETSSFAGIPPTKTCMNCHQQIWVGSDVLAPVRDSYRTDQSIRWERVNNLADFVYFNHSIHVNKGVACTTCHGDVGKMQLTWQDKSLLMEWCLDCHRDPGKNLRPRSLVFDPDPDPAWGATTPDQLLDLNKVHTGHYLTNCSTCHR
jgi:hypothetical protein